MNAQRNGIGTLIFELRELEQITEKELSQGLCSLAEFRKIESGEKLVGKTLLDALLGRMGRAADNFFIILEREQYQLYELRNLIQNAYLMDDKEKWMEGMEKLKEKLSGGNRCDYQFYCKMKFLMEEYSDTDLSKKEKDLIEIIQLTIPSFTIEHIFNYYLCIEEVQLCCLLASLYLEYQKKDKARILLENLSIGIEKHYKDAEEKAKIYPKVAVLLLHVYDVEAENEKWISICEKTINLLAENGILTLMEELLKCYQIGLEEKVRKGQRKFTRLERMVYQNISCELDSIKELNLEYGISYNRKEISMLQNEYNEVYLLQEVIVDYRKRAEKPQSQLGEVIGVEPETISRYEHGKKKPSRRIYQLLVKEIGIPYEQYGVCLPIEDYIVYEKIRQVERFLFRREFINAEQLYLEIEPWIPKEKPENQQYCIRTRTLLDFYLNGINKKEKLERLEKAIRFTLPNYSAVNENFLKYHIPSRYETILLNNIAASYSELGQNEIAIRILKAVLNAYQESEIQEEYHLAVLTLTETTYLECLGRIGYYEEALNGIEKTLKVNLKFGKGSIIPYLIYAKGWNTLKKERDVLTKQKRNACMKYYQQAYWISGLMNNFILQQKLEYLYEKDFNEKLV